MSLYLLWIFLGIGFRTDHLPFIGILVFTYFLSETTNKFLVCMFGLALSWILLDSLRAFPSYLYNHVHIEEIYNAEMKLFGMTNAEGVKITPNALMKSIANPFLDFITGLTYLLWTPVPFIFGTYLFIKNRNILIRFTLCFLLTNVIGVIIYYSYPAAPPWYVDIYGFKEHFDIPGSAAGLLNFDKLTGTSIFNDIYSKSFNVFGAVPSLHSAYPIISAYYARKQGLTLVTIFLIIFTIMTWFSAVYSIHHYVIDVGLGIFCAIFAIAFFEKFLLRTRVNELIRKLTFYVN